MILEVLPLNVDYLQLHSYHFRFFLNIGLSPLIKRLDPYCRYDYSIFLPFIFYRYSYHRWWLINEYCSYWSAQH